MKKATKKIFGRENSLRLEPPLKQLAAEAVLFDNTLRAGSE